MNNTFFYIDGSSLVPNMSETARYLGFKKSVTPEPTIQALIEKAASEMKVILKTQGLYEIFPVSVTPNNDEAGTYKIAFADVIINSKTLGVNLKECSSVALLAATIGPQVDAYIRRAQAFDPVYASICQATGAMYIEEFVNLLNNEIKIQADGQGLTTRSRFSPGYGDVSLEVQRDFFRLLNCSRIGLTLMDTLIMAPEKSVTAFVGMK